MGRAARRPPDTYGSADRASCDEGVAFKRSDTLFQRQMRLLEGRSAGERDAEVDVFLGRGAEVFLGREG